jgi:uncharacterized membrane protein YidH (DUF202 family)
MSLGFVIARFSLWMREISSGASPAMRVRHTGISEVLGECMIGLGGVLTVFPAWRYRVINRAIERGEIEADPRMVMAITVIILTAAVPRDCLYDNFGSRSMISPRAEPSERTTAHRLREKPSRGIRRRSHGLNRRVASTSNYADSPASFVRCSA